MQVSEHLHLLRIPFQIPISPEIKLDRFVNVLLVYGESEVVLVDSGVAGAEEIIFSYLTATGRRPKDIKRMILSHSHPDHLGAARAIKEGTGCEVYAHPAELEWIEDTDLQGRERPVPGFNTLVGGPVPVGVFLNDGDRIELDSGLTIEAIHTPGHSPGSISLHVPADSALFSGDAVPVPGELPIFIDWRESWDSLEKLKKISNIELLLSSWAEPAKKGKKEEAIGAGSDWLGKIKEVVSGVAGQDLAESDPLALCRLACTRLDLPPAAVNPLVARTFAACLGSSK